MATQYPTAVLGVQQQVLDSAKSQLAVVRVAAEKTNRVVFEAAEEYLEVAQRDLTLLAGDTTPEVSDVIARGYDRAAQVLALQEKVLRSLADAWKPVVEKAASDATTLAESTRPTTERKAEAA